VTKKSHRYFIKDAWKLAQSVICDPSIKAIVSTCSNAAVLKEMGFQPDLVIIDESAFGTEADSAVPLSLFADHIILSGDLKQLLPNVKCLHHAEYANQQGLSIFERVLRNGNVPLFRLNINYRMHEEIAILPAALNYGLLDCDPSTAVEEDVFWYFSHFWYSEDGERWRNARQKSPFRSIKETKGIAKKTIRRLFFNTKGSRSAHPDESTSFVNYGNAMAIVEYVCVLLGHWANVDPSKVNFKQLKPSSVTVVTGYAEQKEVIQALLKMALSLIGLSEFPSVVTIDSIQGGQNDVIILDITAANEHHGSLIGFIGKWNRTNVAITRAKKILSIFGNLDSWRSELYNIVEINGRRKFGYLCMDVLDGDVIDTTPVSVERIPATAEELVMDSRNWSIEMPHMDPKESRLKAKGDKIAKIYKTSPEEREKYEKKLWENLQVILKQRDALEKEFKANKEAATDLFQDPVSEAMDIVLEKLGDDEGPIGLEQESEDSEDNPMLAFLEFTSELRGADD
jgi:superfamily I DNA and/or RNA helicase